MGTPGLFGPSAGGTDRRARRAERRRKVDPLANGGGDHPAERRQGAGVRSRAQRQTVEVLREIGYLDQERPLYRAFRVEEMLRFGERLNPNWDTLAAHGYLSELGIPSAKKVGKLSVGQQAQVAMAMCLAKQPALLLLDEPLAALDPVAREGLMHLLLGSVADGQTTVLLSSHAIADLATVCDYIIILSAFACAHRR